MSGHSHWAGIKYKKAVNDAKRGRQWSKCSRAVMVAVREGGADPDMNLKLKYAIDKARQANMPRDTIERAIKRAAGDQDQHRFETVVYEGFGPRSVGFLVEALTDNRHRTSPEIRKLFERAGGKLSPPGSVAYMFEHKGVFAVPGGPEQEESVFEAALAAGADDVALEGGRFTVTCAPSAFDQVRQGLERAGFACESATLDRVPQQVVALDQDSAPPVLRLLEALEEHDDVQHVSANFDLPAALLEELTRES